MTADGNKIPDDDARKMTFVNAIDGSWTAYADGNEVSKGTNTIDPTQDPKSIDLTMTDAQGNSQTVLGIYDITESTRRLCFALPPGKARPTGFGSTPGSQHVLIEFEKIDE